MQLYLLTYIRTYFRTLFYFYSFKGLRGFKRTKTFKWNNKEGKGNSDLKNLFFLYIEW